MTEDLSYKSVLDWLMSSDKSMGELKKKSKAIKTNHELALKLWSQGAYQARLLAVLTLDKKLIDHEFIETLINDLQDNSYDDRNRIIEWLLANQLMKSKKLTALILTWADSNLDDLRRLYWYYQARLRWTGNIQDNTSDLVDVLECKMKEESPTVQWTMNFTAAWIGVYQPEYRQRMVALGDDLGLYMGEKVPKGCTPNYLPEFIRVEVEKRS